MAAAFFQFKATGTLVLHRAHHSAYESAASVVNFETDYGSSNLPFTVKVISGSGTNDA
jgi:hypothetical protein